MFVGMYFGGYVGVVLFDVEDLCVDGFGVVEEDDFCIFVEGVFDCFVVGEVVGVGVFGEVMCLFLYLVVVGFDVEFVVVEFGVFVNYDFVGFLWCYFEL